MKILQLGKFYPIRGGVEKVEHDLMIGLNAKGVECDMLCAGNEGYSGIVERHGRGKVVASKTWWQAAATMIAPTMITSLWRHRKDYGIIHVHHPDPMACLALWLVGYKGRVVLHWHSDVVHQKAALLLYSPLQKWLINRADRIIGTTPIYLKESPFLKGVQHKTTCVPIGIDPVADVNPERIALMQKRYGNRKIVFALGRLVPYKGYEYLISAAQYLSDDYVVLIGGIGPLREKLEHQIRALGLESKVILLGRVEDEDLPVYYHACHVYCMSSVQKSEAFGIVQIEAMSCGKPLISTRIPGSGVAWVNKNGESGAVVEPKNPEQLAEAILAVGNDPEAYRKFSDGSRNRFHEQFTIDGMIDRCLAVYKEVLR